MDGRKLGKSLNIVHNDEIWKDHIHRELFAQKRWPDEWGFLSDIYKGLQQNKTGEDNNPECKKEENEKEAFPKTAACMVGWKSAVKEGGGYGISEKGARGRCDIYRVFQWPKEST